MSADRDSPAEEKRARPCPICSRPSAEAYRPFCSKRCADVDLHRWLAGVYVLPMAEDESAPSPESDDPA